jgi:Mitochondrial ribosomal protein subunit
MLNRMKINLTINPDDCSKNPGVDRTHSTQDYLKLAKPESRLALAPIEARFWSFVSRPLGVLATKSASASVQMATTRLSPAASLLRQSRLFALPPSLAPPTQEVSSQPEGRSDTATLPYPIRAALETPLYSLNRGDWGLKRPLPLKSTTKTGSPVIRIQGGIDTREHIADFESAADHTLTLRKWQELHLPVSKPVNSSSRHHDIGKNIFDPAFDNTTIPASPAHETRLPNGSSSTEVEEVKHIDQKPPTTPPKRWRHEGPWLAGMTGIEFEAYLKMAVRRRKDAFREKIKEHLLADRRERLRRKALEQGEGVGSTVAKVEVTAKEIRDHLRVLRSKPEIFGPMIAEFLDLPEGPSAQGSWTRDSVFRYGRNTVAAPVYADVGPPKTHPSAGLSYLKIGPDTYAGNDPLYGAQTAPPPVQARVLKTRRGPGSITATIGVAGVIADDTDPSTRSTGMYTSFRPQPGGRKGLVKLKSASINSNGTINLNVASSSSSASSSQYRLAEDDSVVRQQGPPMTAAAVAKSANFSMPTLDWGYQRQNRSQVPSADTQRGIDELKRAFDPFGNKSSRWR